MQTGNWQPVTSNWLPGILSTKHPLRAAPQKKATRNGWP